MSVNELSKQARVARTTLTRRIDGEAFLLPEIRRVARVLGTTVAEIETAAQRLVTA